MTPHHRRTLHRVIMAPHSTAAERFLLWLLLQCEMALDDGDAGTRDAAILATRHYGFIVVGLN